MTDCLHKVFASVKKTTPAWIHNPLRNFFTAILTPVFFSYRTGHFLSSLKAMAFSKEGQPIPWYTYPAIDFLTHRPYQDRVILEFGSGQSSLWWAKRSRHLVTFEADQKWFERIGQQLPCNAEIHFVDENNSSNCVAQVKEVLASKPYPSYDVIIIDGLFRYEMIEIALKYMADTGVIICDDAEGYGFYDGFRDSGLLRVDFFGNAPGVILPRCTALYFKPGSFMFNAAYPIPIIS